MKLIYNLHKNSKPSVFLVKNLFFSYYQNYNYEFEHFLF